VPVKKDRPAHLILFQAKPLFEGFCLICALCWTERSISCYKKDVNIEVRLFANFRDYLPTGSNSFGVIKSIEGQMTIKELVREMGLPENSPKVIIVNGLHANLDYLLNEGDVISIFPPLAGG
jgi:sulfur-carrier protein